MSRKIIDMKSMDVQRRRSPRISALNGEEQNRGCSRMIKRRRKLDNTTAAFTPVTKLAKQVWKGRDSPQIADDDCAVEWRSFPQMVKDNQKHDHLAITYGKASIMPAKHILELILDTLQRRDTYEIFAEPVDRDEVEDYYEIIKDPMDFGTMRAKLHEGMYKNLEQFEHDVFLIPENAMHFNSSTTVYFRQARAIHELSKTVFHALKTDPENFVSEFSGTRRRSMRKALSENKDSRSSIAKGQVVGSTSTFRRNSNKNPRNFLTGSRNGRLSSSCQVAERRMTWNDKHFAVDASTFYKPPPPLVLMNQGDISYKDSLMSYVKDLGPIAQMVAKRKLLSIHQSWDDDNDGNERSKVFRTFRDFAGGGHQGFHIKNVIDLTEEREKGNERNTIRPPAAGKEKISDSSCGRVAAGKEKIIDSSCGRVAAGKERTHHHHHHHHIATTLRDDDNLNVGRRPVILALDQNSNNHHVNGARNKKTTSSCVNNNAIEINASRMPLLLLDSTPQNHKPSFTFDLPFLKARLDQMKKSNQSTPPSLHSKLPLHL